MGILFNGYRISCRGPWGCCPFHPLPTISRAKQQPSCPSFPFSILIQHLLGMHCEQAQLNAKQESFLALQGITV